ncbi:MAG: BrxA/BrxB family bacilliredoxin [Thermoanaerobaculia bacterium]
MPYPPEIVQPARDELTWAGFAELRTAGAVEAELAKDGTLLVVVNSVCGCAAGSARPGAVKAVSGPGPKPQRLASVFAGEDLEAVARVRRQLEGFPPSSPSIVLFLDGDPVFLMERRHLEGLRPDDVASALASAFATHCA